VKNLAHLTLILLTHYLVKCKSRSLAIYNNEFILGSAYRFIKSLGDHKIIEWKSVTYLTPIRSKSIVPKSRTSTNWNDASSLNSEWAGLSHMANECAVCKCRQCLRTCAHAGGRHFDFSAQVCNKDDVMWRVTFWQTITASHVCRYSFNHSNVHLIIALMAQFDTSNFPR